MGKEMRAEVPRSIMMLRRINKPVYLLRAESTDPLTNNPVNNM
jgi:hypothetical protein